MAKRKRARQRRRMLPSGDYSFTVFGNEKAIVVYDEQTGDAWSICRLCDKMMPLDFEHAPSVQVCRSCVESIEWMP